MNKKLHFETLAIKSTQNPLADIRPVSTPIYLSTNYQRNEDGSYNHDFVYSRHGNPNRQILENSIAQLENGKVCYAFASGMAAIHAVFQSLKPGDHVLMPDDVYYHVFSLISEVFGRWELDFTRVDMTDLDAVANAIRFNTALIWVETPSNPRLKITDIEEIAKLAHSNQALLAVDNTWLSPVLQQPLQLGADLVVHSTTKYFGGHSDVMGGCVILKNNDEMSQKIARIRSLSGGVPSPFDCWLITRGIMTLHLRVRAQTETAGKLARFLTAHPGIEKVNYPGLKSHPQHPVAVRQMKNGFGAMLSIQVKGDEQIAMRIANKLTLFTSATSLGAVESLVEHRKSVEGPESSTPENLLRISVGLENADDLIVDWEQALG